MPHIELLFLPVILKHGLQKANPRRHGLDEQLLTTPFEGRMRYGARIVDGLAMPEDNLWDSDNTGSQGALLRLPDAWEETSNKARR